MRDLFGRRFPRSGGWNIRAMSMGLWLAGGAIATVGAMVGAQSSVAPPKAEHVQAGPIDDTIDYLDCLIRLLQGEECDEDFGQDPATEPVDPASDPSTGEPAP